MTTTTARRTGDEVMQAIERVRPVLERYRDEAEQQRRLPDATVSAMRDEGLFDLWLPRELGGDELDLTSYLRAVEELSRIDSAAGWNFANTATAGVIAGFMQEDGAREVFGNSALGAGTIAPRGRAVPVEGGYRVTGRWPFASGCHNAQWVGGNCLVFEGEAPRMNDHGMPDFTLMFFPASECQIIDTWNPTGMRGTGSADVAVQDVFVPARRTFPLFTVQPRLDAPLFKMRIEQAFFTAHAAVGLGIARAAVDAFLELAQTKTPILNQSSLASRGTVHAEVAKTQAALMSAQAFFYGVAGEIQAAIESGPGIPEALEVKRRLACINASEASERVVDAMYHLGGTTAIESNSVLDRCLRDIHAVNQHFSVSPVWWEKTGQYYFGQGLGMP